MPLTKSTSFGRHWARNGLLNRAAQMKVPRQRRSATVESDIHQEKGKDIGQFDEETDVLIIGSGAAGLTAALRCHALSLSSIVVEKTGEIGGTSAFSGGGMWIPCNPYLKAQGDEDSIEKALTYMNHCIGEVGPASSNERRMAFVENAPRMIEFLHGLGFRGRASGRYPNYYPNLPGGNIPRGVESVLFDARKLGTWYKLVRRGPRPYPPVYTDEAPRLFRSATSLSNLLYAARILGIRGTGRRLLGQLPVTMGPALVCQLLHLNLQRQFSIWCHSPLIELIVDNGIVVGGLVNRGEGKMVRVRARRGVLLCAGGFARNAEMRTRHQENPVSAAWTSTQEADVGDAIRIGMSLHAQVALMDDAWWGPTVVDPSTGDRFFVLFERVLPHSIIVDSSGSRFMNEAQSYTDAVQDMYKRNREVPAIPAWIILDSNHRRKYPFASMLPGYTPTSTLKSGFVYKGKTLEELANQLSLDPTNLHRTVQRFNDMARRGEDEDFGRGGNDYDQFFADDNVKPNGNLGPIEKAPFYALKVWPGDLGTKGGLLTDENARVIGESGEPIHGLYAAGNTTASVMGRTYPGPGSTLGPALTFSYIAVNHMAGQDSSKES
jgi:3-oxosteroid 1-dehydrogenase